MAMMEARRACTIPETQEAMTFEIAWDLDCARVSLGCVRLNFCFLCFTGMSQLACHSRGGFLE
jgi:hypothetical protein